MNLKEDSPLLDSKIYLKNMNQKEKIGTLEIEYTWKDIIKIHSHKHYSKQCYMNQILYLNIMIKMITYI